METTAQEALKAFEDSWVTLQWTQMTDAQRNTYLRQHLGLQIAARKEEEANKIEAEQQAEIQAEQRRQNIINCLTSLGYQCDNSQADWRKLYNRPEIFGDRWQQKAGEAHAKSTSIDDFINLAIQYLR